MRLLGLGCSCDNTEGKLVVHIALHCGSLRRYLRDVTHLCHCRRRRCARGVVLGDNEGGGKGSDRLEKLPVSEYEQ